MRSSDVRRDIRLAGQVKRYATWPVLHQQSTGEHSWQVLRIYIEIFGAPSPEVTVYITHHDSAELVVGDPPFPLKAQNVDLKQIYDRLENSAMMEMRGEVLPVLSPEERVRIKICDLLEMWEFGEQEQMMGNRYAEPIIDDTLRAVRKMVEDPHFPSDHFDKVDRFIQERSGFYV